MMRAGLSILACMGLVACGDGNPFTGTGTGGTGGEELEASGIPEDIRSDLDSVTYNAAAQTLTVTGVGLDETPFTAVYTRKPALDTGGYEAYTAQDDPLDRHATAFVKQINGTTGAISATGGQFTYYFRGGTYSRTSYSPPAPESGLVTYAGSYAGILNVRRLPPNDLLPVTPGTPIDIQPTQAAETTGTVFINADFNDNQVNGSIFNRRVVDTNTAVDRITLVPTDIAADGTFQGDTERLDVSGGTASRQTTGTYAGVFGGTGASEIAGSFYAEDHLDEDSTNVEEQGVFVLSKCGTAGEDPTLCAQVND